MYTDACHLRHSAAAFASEPGGSLPRLAWRGYNTYTGRGFGWAVIADEPEFQEVKVMNVATVLKAKGRAVATAHTETKLKDIAIQLAQKKIFREKFIFQVLVIRQITLSCAFSVKF